MKFEQGMDTRAIYSLLRDAKVGETITYRAMSAACGKRISGASNALQRAKMIAKRENQIAFRVERNHGLVRLSDAELATNNADVGVSRSRRLARREAKTMACVENYAGLSPQHQIAHTIRMSFFGAVAYMANGRRLDKIGNKVSGRSGDLPIKETLELFAKN